MKKNDINEILKRPCNKACDRYGASMGRQGNKTGNPERLHLQRIRFVDGDYDTGGAYWGGDTPLFCAFSDEQTQNDIPIMVFVRASNRAEAKEMVLSELSASGSGRWTFYQ